MPSGAAEEVIVRLGVLPLRLNIDQDAMNFLVQFLCFSPNSDSAQPGSSDNNGGDTTQLATATSSLSSGGIGGDTNTHCAEHVSASDGMCGEGSPADTSDGIASDGVSSSAPTPQGPYFKLFVIQPLFARIDTVSKHVKINELMRGARGWPLCQRSREPELYGLRVMPIAQLIRHICVVPGNFGELAGLVSLEQAHVSLPTVIVKGAHGLNRLLSATLDQLQEHIRKTQIPGIVGVCASF